MPILVAYTSQIVEYSENMQVEMLLITHLNIDYEITTDHINALEQSFTLFFL